MSVRDFPTRPQGSAPDSVPFLNWLDALGQRQNIDLLQELTSVASGDEIAIFDASETGNNKTKKATVSNIGSTIVGGGFAGSFSTITATGLVDISASGAGQIKFPATQNASSDANTLDDYEEGTWTPTITAAVGTITTASASGTYTKIGSAWFCAVDITITTNGTGDGTVQFSLPFTSSAPSAGVGREQLVTGDMLAVVIGNGATLGSVLTYNNGYPGGDGRLLRCAFTAR